MHVLLAIVSRQIRRQLFRRSVLGGTFVIALLALLSVLIGVRSYDVQAGRQNQLLQQVVREQARTAWAMGWQVEPALRVLRPLNPAAILVRGVDPPSTAYWDFGPGGVVPSIAMPAHDAADISPIVDLEFLIRVFLGLLALALSASSHGMVRPDGELAGLVSFPISRGLVWIGQTIASLAVSAAAWLAVAATVVLVTLAAADADLTWPIFGALRDLTIPTIVYLAVMVAIGSANAILFQGGLVRLISVFLVWLIICILAPTTLLSVVRILRPVSSQLAMIAARDSALAVELRSAELEMGDFLAQRSIGERSISNVLDSSKNPDLESVWNERVRLAREQATAIEAAWRSEVMAHDKLLDRLEWLSPASLFWRAAADSSRSGQADRRAWDELVREYSYSLQRRLFDDRPRVTVSFPADGGRQALVLNRHPPLRVRDLPRFDASGLADKRRNRLPTFIIAMASQSLAVVLLSVWLFVRIRR